ncbi:MAG TPA: DUF2135 domain-containing protein [Methylotenera sp.]|nr:DUF2135 domain-containing protein [Methylotenera sp.]HPH05324.1 DUF2135 domain-containing protein [Methylotenera sp.]HPN01636.1 DUF2135 domain-containing protein [Methylotenera sp.]
MPIFLKKICLLVLSFSFAEAALAENDAPLASPRGGWNYSGMTDKSADTSVTYPYSPIDRGAQRNRAIIKGHIEAAGKNRVPKLVVNGNPLPLNTDAEGRYTRHYAFGGGSNSVELKTADGKTAKRVQFYEANPTQQLPKLRIICAWDAPEAEVDLHVLTPDAQHVTWSSPILTTGGGLDVDSVDGPGPEMFSTSTPMRGVYNIYINYWGNLSEAGYNFDQSQLQKPIITTRITLVFNENTPSERREDFVVPLRKIGELNFIKSFVY